MTSSSRWCIVLTVIRGRQSKNHADPVLREAFILCLTRVINSTDKAAKCTRGLADATVCFNKSVTWPVSIDVKCITKGDVVAGKEEGTSIYIARRFRLWYGYNEYNGERLRWCLRRQGDNNNANEGTSRTLEYYYIIFTRALSVVDVWASLKLEHQPRVRCARISFWYWWSKQNRFVINNYCS